ncbi:Ger(x)C family spore germination protein [Cohnella sp.]|uniref:Ger(x)C family spore germination protein n=1 Tax=Cohnella sp. TaxID=1883426 RepID=UPI00356B5733
MTKKLVTTLLIAGITLSLSGCWDIKSLQDVNYFTGIGIDYKDNKYHIYIQQLDFSSVAKTDAGKSEKPAMVWIGHAEGISISEAVFDLYKTAQQTVFWGHLNAIIFSENMLKKGDLLGVFDSLLRNPEIRYTSWVYGTKKEINEIFITKPFFNLSPLNSILYSPNTNYKQRPIISPMRFSQFIKEVREPGNTALLPTLGISDHIWVSTKKPDPKLEMDGIFALHNDKYKDWISSSDLLGIKWLERKTDSTRIVLKQNDKITAALKLTKPKSKIRIHKSNGAPVFDIEIKVAGALLEVWTDVEEKKLESLASELIEKEIRSAYQVGMTKHIDLFRLEHSLYRKEFPLWKKLTDNGSAELRPIALGKVKVTVKLTESGVYKLKRKLTPY